jgi:lipid II:glycine glycyltransferase (peptidoglycan interpeptide bridge formation enzyme)
MMPEVQPQRTLTLDLTRSAEELRRDISQSNRNLINGAVRRGIRIEAVTKPYEAHIELFLAMMRDTVARDKFHPYPDSYYADTIRVLTAASAATLYFAYAADQPVAGAIAFDFAGTRYYAHAAAFQALNREHKAAVPLLWQMVVDAQEAGAHTFDFWGIAPNDDPHHPRAGFTRFKRSFGGEVKEYAGTWDLPIRPVKYRLYRAAKSTLKLAA